MDLDRLQEIAQTAIEEERVHKFPPLVHNRVLHADADILSYKACDMDYSYAENVTKLKELIDVWRRLAGAEMCVLHLTLGTKGREDIATVKEYQGQRIRDEEKSARVKDLRLFMSEYNTVTTMACNNYDQEADDSLCQAMYSSIEHGNDSVLFSSDKDLWMVPGKHINPQTFEIEEYPQGYGSTRVIVNSEGKKKCIGRGTSWFWHQMLMGDSADNIPGLPHLTKDLCLKYAPTQRMIGIQTKLSTGRMPSGKTMTTEQKRRTQEAFSKAYKEMDQKLVGPALAVKYLANCNTDLMAYQYVLEAYRAYYGQNEVYFTWDNKRIETNYKDMFLEQARLLWMKRVPNEDVQEWLIKINSQPTRSG